MPFQFGSFFDKLNLSGTLRKITGSAIKISFVIALVITGIVLLVFWGSIDEDSSKWSVGVQMFAYSWLVAIVALMLHDKSTEAEYREKHGISDVSKVVSQVKTGNADDMSPEFFKEEEKEKEKEYKSGEGEKEEANTPKSNNIATISVNIPGGSG
jgi:hypothetical protein